MQNERNGSEANCSPADQPASLEQQISRWNFELGLTAGFLPDAPLDALEWSRRIAREVSDEMQRDRGDRRAEALLSPLRGEARNLVALSFESSRRFLAESERRHREFEAREQAVFARPLPALRKPWPNS